MREQTRGTRRPSTRHQLLQVELDRDWDMIPLITPVDLPLSQEDGVASHFVRLWINCAFDSHYWGDDSSYPAPAERAVALGVMATYYLARIVRRRTTLSTSAFDRDVLERMSLAGGDDAQVHQMAITATALAHFAGIQALKAVMSLNMPAGMTSIVELRLVETEHMLTKCLIDAEDDETRRLLGSILMAAQSAWAEMLQGVKRPWLLQSHVFSVSEGAELPAIAERNPHLVRRYGARLSWIFEQETARLLQSLGLVVTSTRRFERSVDLICVVPTRPDPQLIIVDAKSTRRQYTLPASDQRALREYVEQVRRNLVTLPSLVLVVIVGPDPGVALSGRLRECSADWNVPVRYLRAATLAAIRHHLPGPPELSDLLDRIRLGPEVVEPQLVRDLFDLWHRRSAAQDELIRAWLDV